MVAKSVFITDIFLYDCYITTSLLVKCATVMYWNTAAYPTSTSDLIYNQDMDLI